MPRIKKAGPWNPQKATAYVGKGVLKYGDTIPAVRGHITPVPNGPLIKKKGEFKGSTLKNGGNMAKIKKAEDGVGPFRSFGFKHKDFKGDVKRSADRNRKLITRYKTNPFTGEDIHITKDVRRATDSTPRKVFKGKMFINPKNPRASVDSRVWKEDGKVVKKEVLKNGGKMMMSKVKKADNGKKVRLKEDSRAYITKVKTDDKGNVTSLKSRRTVKGLLSGAPRSKKIMKAGGKIKKK